MGFSGAPQVQNVPWLPSDNNMMAANSDISTTDQSTGVLTAGTVYLSRVMIRATIMPGSVWAIVQTAGSGASSGSFLGIYSSSGLLLATTADIGANLVATQGFKIALPSPLILTPGFVWVGIVSNLATTQPIMRASSNSGNSFNTGITINSQSRSASDGTGVSVLPASFTPSSLSPTLVGNFWCGLAA